MLSFHALYALAGLLVTYQLELLAVLVRITGVRTMAFIVASAGLFIRTILVSDADHTCAFGFLANKITRTINT